MNQDERLEELISQITEIITCYKKGVCQAHPYDIAKDLQDLREINADEYKSICKKYQVTYLHKY